MEIPGSGIVAVYKPKGPTSHDVVALVRRATGVARVGHAGTLDPLASGVLVLGIGREATKRLASEVAKEKEYMATIRLGVESTTDDEEGIKKTHEMNERPRKERIEEVLKQFVGTIKQVPPPYSAIKVQGKAAYKYARRGALPELSARTVVIFAIALVKYSWPTLVLRVVTGPGVYIRSLARDVGLALGTGAYLADLERTRVGEFTKEQAIHLEM